MLTDEQKKWFRKNLKFKCKDTFTKFEYWINNCPESYGGNDLKMFAEFVLSVLENNDDIDWNSVRKISEFNPIIDYNVINSYIEKYSNMKLIYEVIQRNENIKDFEDALVKIKTIFPNDDISKIITFWNKIKK